MTRQLTNAVELELGGETYQLKPSLKAANAVSRQFGGFLGAMQAISQSNLEAFFFIIKHGIGKTNTSTDDLNAAIWAAGVPNLIKPVMRYVSILQNGGRDPDPEEMDDGEEMEGNGAS